MAENSIEVDPAEIATTPKSLLASILYSPFVNGLYPSQDNTHVIGLAGEYRGTYADRWKPKSSFFDAQRPGGKRHGGADIYATVGTPLVAVVDGELEQRPDDGDAIGNRLWLTFDDGGERWRLIYGHLSSFVGGPRSVTQGDVIGHSGCSGNADYDGTCSGHNRCNMSSSHVHFQLVRVSDGVKFNPIEVLRWSVKYQDDDRDVDCEQFP
ncbi:M23 family metallopeptidase [Bradyrhizobium sp. Cp5.3]|uniref:M23 family metallopeptidase n=1 Tax=Bradyrhizobium sp. Cp5.3 TaxID=443598 RepID=UPI0004808E94|nr:M23 family metallopeptidase [Bradyrhizobium sp. Cp5.3]